MSGSGDPRPVEQLTASAEGHAAAQRAEAERLQAELAALNARLGHARAAQERLQHPSVLATETARHRIEDGWSRWAGRGRRLLRGRRR
jgi:multidrug resistance efflux pump